MLKQYLKDNIAILDTVINWEEAIKTAAAPLLKQNLINENYIQKMINNVYKNGSYIVIMPEIALAHARPKDGVINQGISFLKLNNSVKFPEDKDVKIIIVLAAKEDTAHLDLMAELAEILIDDQKIKNISSAKDINIIKKELFSE